MTLSKHHRNLAVGIFYICITWLFFSSSAAIAKDLSKTSSVSLLVTIQHLVGLLFVLPWVLRDGTKSLKTSRFPLLFIRATLGLLGFVCLFVASGMTSLVDAILLNNTAPFFVPFIMLFWLKEPINHKLWPGIILGFIGVGLILKPGREMFQMGALVALGSGVTYALSMVCMRELSFTEKFRTILFYYFIIGTLIPIPFAISDWETPTMTTLLLMALVGIFTATGVIAMHRAFFFAKASHLSPFGYSGVIFSGILDWIFWGHVPDLLAMAGIVCVCIGGIQTILYSPFDPQPKNPSN